MSNDRLQAIGSAMRGVLAPVFGAYADVSTASEAMTAARDTQNGTRMTVMGELAYLAGTQNWSEADVDAGARIAIALGNAETPKSVATFIGECKRAMHPAVRSDFAQIQTILHSAWETEGKLDKAAPKPLRKAFIREYHGLMHLLEVGKKGARYLTTDDLVAYAVSRDPDHNAEKIMDRLKKIRADLAQFHADFPVDDIGSCVDFLGEITEKELVAARARKLGIEPATTVMETPPAQQTADDTVEDSANPDELLDGITPATGAFDLDDLAGIKQAA